MARKVCIGGNFKSELLYLSSLRSDQKKGFKDQDQSKDQLDQRLRKLERVKERCHYRIHPKYYSDPEEQLLYFIASGG
jgi:hypothetical protein